MPLNRALVDADNSVDVLYGVLSALMMTLPEAVRETLCRFAAGKWTLSHRGVTHVANG